MSIDAKVAVLEIDASTPPIRIKFPAGASSVGIKYLENGEKINIS